MAGVDLISVKELLGHKSLTMTMRYAHLAPGHKRKAVNILDNVLKNTEDEKICSQFVHNFKSELPTTYHKSIYDLWRRGESNPRPSRCERDALPG